MPTLPTQLNARPARSREWASPTVMCICVAAGLVACREPRHATPEPATKPTEGEPAGTHCGNGRVESEEACDHGVSYAEGCPRGWGVCWVCASDCAHFLLWPANAACSVTKKRRADGKWREHWQQTCTYDAKGNTEACTEKSGGGGEEVLRRRFIRTERPATVTYECDSDRDGRPDYREREHYDAEGVRTLWELDKNADGQVTRVRPKPGRRTSAAPPARDYHQGGTTVVQELDGDGDGAADWRAVRKYDERGSLVFFEWVFADRAMPASQRALPCDAKDRGSIPTCRTSVDHERRGACEPFEHQKELDYRCLTNVYERAPKREYVEGPTATGGEP